MLLYDVFEKLSYGVLSGHVLGNEGSGTIDEKHWPRVVKNINDGLQALSIEFPLVERVYVIELVDHITTYHLHERYAESTGSNTRYPYIKDMFGDRFEKPLKILAVHDESGRSIPLDDEDDPTSIMRPRYDRIQVPNPITGRALSVTVSVPHRSLRGTGEDVLSQDVEIPDYLVPALESYVGWQVFSDMNGPEHVARSNVHWQKWLERIKRTEDEDLVGQSYRSTNVKFHERGFV